MHHTAFILHSLRRQALMVLGAAMSSTPWACQRRLSWCPTSVRPSWSMGAWRCWLGSAWWHLTLSACLVRSSPSRLCQCPSMPMMLSLAPLEWMLKCCSGWALWSCAVPRRSLSGTPWRLLVTTASLASSPVMKRVRRRCAQLSWRTAAWPWWHLQVLWLRLPSHATRSHGSSELSETVSYFTEGNQARVLAQIFWYTIEGRIGSESKWLMCGGEGKHETL